MDIVLVHGLGPVAGLWNDVAERLTDEAHRVWAPSLSGVGELIEDGAPDTDLSGHVHEVRDLVAETEPGFVLVGFGYGGLVAGLAAAEIAERVRRLIYVDAFVPQPGRSRGHWSRREFPVDELEAGHFAPLTVPDDLASLLARSD